MTAEELLDRLRAINVSRRGKRPALYKPLLLLLLFERVRSGRLGPHAFAEIEPRLHRLIELYSPEDSPASIGQPWWHLPTDGLWRVFDPTGRIVREEGTSRGDTNVPSLEVLRAQHGDFAQEIQDLLTNDPGIAQSAVEVLIAQFFPQLTASQRDELFRDIAYRDSPDEPSVIFGRPYSRIDGGPKTARRDPFEIDPDAIDRGNRAHVLTVDSLAEFLRSKGIEALNPNAHEPPFDLAWRYQGIFIAEIKSTTDANEEKQLRLGLGQILRYRHILQCDGFQNVGAVLVPERRPHERSWEELCDRLGVLLAWPGAFDRLFPPV